jgi:hypothetical protein
MSANASFSRYSPQVRLTSGLLDSGLWGQLKPVVYSGPIENEETLHQRVFYVEIGIRSLAAPFVGTASAFRPSPSGCSQWRMKLYKSGLLEIQLYRAAGPNNGHIAFDDACANAVFGPLAVI